MKFRLFLALCSVIPNAIATQAIASGPSAAKSLNSDLRNVELNESGNLNLLVVDSIGNPQPQIALQLECGPVQTAGITNELGRLAVPQLVGGTCIIQLHDQVFAFRVWKNGTAPPKSLQSIALVNDNPAVVRGNRFRRSSCPPNQCDQCGPIHHLSAKARYGLGITALGATAAYMAFSRDNASE